MRLHDNLSSGNGYKVRLLLAQLGVPFEWIDYDIDRGATRQRPELVFILCKPSLAPTETQSELP